MTTSNHDLDGETSTGDPPPIQVLLETSNDGAVADLLLALSDHDIEMTHVSKQGSGEETAVIDLGMLTTKQKQTLQTALEAGYYERPRQTDLSELADEIAISKSAVSQRLRSAEAKLIKQAFGEF